MSEEMSKQLPKATDLSVLLDKKNSTTLKSFEYEGYIWEFEIRDDISTKVFNDILKSYYEVSDDRTNVITNMERYDRKKLVAFIAKAPFEVSETKIVELQQNNAGFVRKLLSLIPYDPLDISLPDEAKKKLRKSLGLG